MESVPARSRRSAGRRLRDVVVIGACVAAGFALASSPRLFQHDDALSSHGANPRAQLSDLAARLSRNRGASAPAEVAGEGAPELPAPAAPTPAAAVDGLLAAEARGDYAASYGFLDAAERATYGSRAEWTAAHAQLPSVIGHSVDASSIASGRADVTTTVRFRATLDRVLGLVPARATVTWPAVAEDGGWRVAFGERQAVPRYPPELGAITATGDWVRDRQACRRDRLEYRGGLLGDPGLLDGLCGTKGPIRLRAASALDSRSAVDPFLAAFGPSVFSWARVVPVTAPRTFGAVLAPIGDHWVVVGVVDPAGAAP